MPRRPNVSILLKLYAIMALFATATVMLAIVAVDSARRHTELTAEFEAALQGAQTVERINSLIYAVVAEGPRAVPVTGYPPRGRPLYRPDAAVQRGAAATRR